MWIVKETVTGTKKWIKVSKATGSKTAKKAAGSKTTKKAVGSKTVKKATGSKTVKKTTGSKKIPKGSKKFVTKKRTPARKRISHVKIPFVITDKEKAMKEEYWTDLEKWYNMPPIKKIELDKWTSNLSKSDINIINKLINKVKPDLERNEIKFLVVPLQMTNGYFLIDYVWDYAQRAYKEYLDIPTNIVMMVVKLSDSKFYRTDDVLISFQHNLDKSSKNIVFDIFQKYMGNHLVWNKSDRKSIVIV